jgi:hypothetical protein
MKTNINLRKRIHHPFQLVNLRCATCQEIVSNFYTKIRVIPQSDFMHWEGMTKMMKKFTQEL